jgi:hypothetical protein
MSVLDGVEEGDGELRKDSMEGMALGDEMAAKSPREGSREGSMMSGLDRGRDVIIAFERERKGESLTIFPSPSRFEF